jgi:predicted RNA-binding protein with EMAP domain
MIVVRAHTRSSVQSLTLAIGRLDARVQVARVQVVERHPDADSLYVCQVDLGEATRQLVRASRECWSTAGGCGLCGDVISSD